MRLILFTISILLLSACQQKQVADDAYQPETKQATFSTENAPVIAIDEAHHNFHTVDGRYKAFADVLRQDGCVVKASTRQFSEKDLKQFDILVISNALNEKNVGGNNWTVPTYSAFTDDEIAAVKNWVAGGGALFLIADHMPFPGAAEKLAKEFGITFNNGFAWRSDEKQSRITFSRTDSSLREHPITNGKSASEKIQSVTSFTGQAFQLDPNISPLMVFGSGYESAMPDVAWQFSDSTPTVAVDGWAQGAALEFGSGRIAVFGEAAMFTAQISRNGTPMGMNAPGAEENQQLLLNIIHWLARAI